MLHLPPSREFLHGAFSREIPPVLTIDSGDTVVFGTLDASWCVEPRTAAGPQDTSHRMEPIHPRWQDGHCLTGPVAIRGAEPGMTLEIQIGEIVPGPWGWTVAGGWPHDVNERLGFTEDGNRFFRWSLDAERMVGRNQHGHEVQLRPFMGVMGMPPPEPGEHPTPPPRPTGGNLDCKELVAGSTLYLPIAVPGGLFSVGDGHAVQGDGELCVTALECPMERVQLTFHVREDISISSPRIKTRDAWITLGLHEDLQKATYAAIESMLDLMVELYGVERQQAFGLASLVVDLRITQIVNGVRGVHAVLPFGALRIP
jgi:acetamidase/formamidase